MVFEPKLVGSRVVNGVDWQEEGRRFKSSQEKYLCSSKSKILDNNILSVGVKNYKN